MGEIEEQGQRAKEGVVPMELRLSPAWPPRDQRWVSAGHPCSWGAIFLDWKEHQHLSKLTPKL